MKTKTNSVNVFFKNLFKENKNRPLNKTFFQRLLSTNGKPSFSGNSIPKAEKIRFDHFNYYRIIFFVFFVLASVGLSAQTVVLPSPSSCTSKDLLLIGARLPAATACDNCTEGTTQTRTLLLSIDNKTGSKRTSFAFWGTLKIYNANGTLKSSTPITGCNGPIEPDSINELNFGTISYLCGESLQLTDLFLAWTTSNRRETCPLESSLIAPKCGTVPSIQIYTGLDATAVTTAATCTTGGSILVSPFGGRADYTVAIGTDSRTVTTGGSTNFTGLGSGSHTINITDADGCTISKVRTVGSSTVPTANAGSDFTKTCTTNPNGKQIGEATDAAFSYSWSPSTGLSAANVSNPTANPSSTTTYTVTKTNTASGCFGTDSVDVTVNNASVTANAGSDFSKSCTTNPNGKQIGEATDADFTYSWSPSTGLSAANVSNPTANPSSTTTYTVTKTNTASGCSGTDSVDITVSNATVTANAGSDFSKTCTTNPNGKQIGEATNAAFSYSWSPSTGLSAANVSNPTANPSSTTTYTVTKTNIASGCFGTDSVDVTVSNDIPDAPTVCMVQPSLCGPATGSITINSPIGSQYEYSIDNGNTWQSSPNFNSLAAGSVSGIKVKNINSGCISSAANCSVSNCTASRVMDPAETLNIEKVMEKEILVKAFPNPFKNTINFVVEVPESGEGSLDVMNMFGQKVKTIFKGTFKEGKNTYEVNLPSHQPGTLIYILNIGDKRMTGKLIQM